MSKTPRQRPTIVPQASPAPARADTVQQTTAQMVSRALKNSPTPETILPILRETQGQASALFEQSPNRAAHACAAGCSFCCHLPVDVSPLEAFTLAAHLQTTLAPEALAALRQRLAATVDRLRGLSFEAHARARVPCVLLVDGQCSVYDQRPLACRAWNSTSVARCEAVFHGDPVTMVPPVDTEAYIAVWQVARGLADGIKRAQRDGRTYELHSILLRVLETPTAALQWLQGDNVLAGCTVGAFAE